jgi:putative mRNA 3-end processing factor
VLSDHADWPGLLDAIRATGASMVLATHGNTGPFVRYLREEMKLDAHALATQFRGEAADDLPADEQHEPGTQAADT